MEIDGSIVHFDGAAFIIVEAIVRVSLGLLLCVEGGQKALVMDSFFLLILHLEVFKCTYVQLDTFTCEPNGTGKCTSGLYSAIFVSLCSVRISIKFDECDLFLY